MKGICSDDKGDVLRLAEVMVSRDAAFALRIPSFEAYLNLPFVVQRLADDTPSSTAHGDCIVDERIVKYPK